MKIHIIKNEEYCEKLNRNLNRCQILEDIIIFQRSSFNKTSLGYVGEASCKENENTNTYKNVEESGSSTQPVMKVEEKCSRLSENKNEEKENNHV